MFVNQRKMMRTSRNSGWRYQQKAYQTKGEFFKKTWTAKPQPTEIETETRMRKYVAKLKFFYFHQEFDHSYDGGQVSLSNFADDQFKLMKGKLGKNSRRWRKEAISNTLIVKEILSHMNFSALKIARLVCKEWNSLANFELGRRNCCRLRFDRNFLFNENLDLEILRNSVDLSWMEFDLENLEKMELDYIATFWGTQIKMLKIPPFDFSLINRFFNAGEFPNVKSLSFHNKILDAENSETITKDPTVYKSIAKVQLERLLIGNQYLENRPEFVDQINQILESNQKSLKFLELPLQLCSSSTFRSRSQMRLCIPGILSQVSTIHFQINCSDRNRTEGQQFQFQLPQGFEQDNLPNLKTVRFEFNIVNSWSDCRFLPPEETKTGNASCSILSLRSVINLEIGFKNSSHRTRACSFVAHHFLPSIWFPWFSSLFPNIQKVAVDILKNGEEILRHVFTVWPNLSTLEIHSQFSRRTESKILDSVITGLSKEKCEELRENRRLKRMSLEIGEIKTEPNLNSLKGLKRLEICVFGPFHQSPVSKLSSLYAFDLNPELKVTIRHFPEEVKKCECWMCRHEELERSFLYTMNFIKVY